MLLQHRSTSASLIRSLNRLTIQSPPSTGHFFQSISASSSSAVSSSSSASFSFSSMSLTTFFKTVEAPAAAAKKAASATKPSPKKPSAATRKRKPEEEDEDDNDEDAAPASKNATEDDGEETVAASAASSAPAAKKARAKGDGLEALIPDDWYEVLRPEFSKPYWPSIEKFLRQQEAAKVSVFPQRGHIFRALDLCPFDKVKVVIIGQDPYHDDGQAEGLCFSVPPGVKIPSSLNNIYKELKDDLGEKNFMKPKHGNLVEWAKQGILLLNTGLTVKAHEANSHKSVGWFNFTDAIIKAIAKEKKGVVFLLWGAHAQAKAKLIDAGRHHILKSVHPSGLSASKGFYGCKHFSKCNALLEKDGNKPINWQV